MFSAVWHELDIDKDYLIQLRCTGFDLHTIYIWFPYINRNLQ